MSVEAAVAAETTARTRSRAVAARMRGRLYRPRKSSGIPERARYGEGMIAWRSLAALALVLGTATRAAAGEPTERLRTFFERANGVSLAPDYRVQFERVLQLGSYDELLARLRDKAGPAARGETTRAMAVPSPMGPLREEIAAPQTSRTATLVVAEIRDRRNAIVSDAPDVVATDARLSALVPPAPAPTAGTASPRATAAVSP